MTDSVENDKSAHRARTVQGDERQRSLVLAAYQLIAEKGFEELRTRDVAARAGVNIATLHYYFASKEDLIQGVVDYLLQVFATTPAIPEADFSTPWGHIRTMFLGTQYRMQATPEMFIVLSELALRSLRSPSIQPAMKKLDAGWHGYVEQVVADGIRQGQFRQDLDAASTATALIILLKGVSYHSITNPETVDFERILQDVQRLLF